MNEIIVFIAGFLAAFIGSMSGGGAGIISVAALLYIGLPINNAIATNKFGDAGFFVTSIRNFRHAHLIKKRALPPIIAINIIGVAVGTPLVIYTNEDLFGKIIAGLLILVILVELTGRKTVTKERKPNIYWPVAYFGSSVATGVSSAGTGILGTLTLVHLRGFTPLQSLAHGFFANSIGKIVGLSILIFTDLIDYRLGAIMFVANMIGAHFGSKIAISHGNKFVRMMIMLMAVGVLIQLLVLT